MRDRFGREIRALRVSVTDRCDLRCTYCAAEPGCALAEVAARAAPRDPLSASDLTAIVAAAIDVGLRRVRLTGGEPLVRRDLVDIVGRLARLDGLERLSLTTNAQRLAALAPALAEAGLSHVNVSIDSLDPARFAAIRHGGSLARALEGIDSALACGLAVKVNAVLMRGTNDDEVAALAALARERPVHVRFLEYMPPGEWSDANAGLGRLVPGDEVLERLVAAYGPLEPVSIVEGDGPAVYHRLPGGRGLVGIITAVTRPFCERCNRLRVLADGRLRPCLFAEREVDLRPALARGREALVAAFRRAIAMKPESGARARGFALKATGG